MIVADTNTIAYLFLPSNYSADSERVLEKDSDWIVPVLWRSEFRNILAVYQRKGLIEFKDAVDIQRRAELLLNANEYEVDSLHVLQLAKDSGCSAYDCEFIYLAMHTQSKLVTADKQILGKFPGVAVSAKEFVTITSNQGVS